jgi:pumilio family protein 6
MLSDTKLMGKAFVSDIIELGPQLLEDKIGRRAVAYLLTPTSSKHFMPSTLASLAASASRAKELGTSKKDAAVRRSELLGYASEGLLSLAASKGAELVADPPSGLILTEMMLYTSGDKAAAIAALAEPLSAPFAGDGSHVLELAHATRTYKTLLGGGHFSMATKAIEVVDAQLGKDLANAFWAAISADEAGGHANAIRVAAAAPFVAVELLAALPDPAPARAILAKGKDEIVVSEMKGANVLLEKLA